MMFKHFDLVHQRRQVRRRRKEQLQGPAAAAMTSWRSPRQEPSASWTELLLKIPLSMSPPPGIANAQEQQRQHKVKDAQETGRLNLGSDLMSMLMVAGGVAVAFAAAFLANKKC